MRRPIYWILLISALSVSGCVDREFNLDDMNTEISIGDGQDLDLPFGYFEERTMEEIINMDKVNHLYTNDKGDYYFALEETDGVIEVGFPQSASIPSIDERFPISIGSIVEGYTGPIPPGTVTGTLSDKAGLCFYAQFPDYIKAIDRVMLKPDEGRETASLKLRIDLNSLAVANDGSEFTVTFRAPEGMELYDGDTPTGKETIVKTIAIPAGESSGQAEVNFKDINLTPGQYTLTDNGSFTYETSFSFDVDYSFTARSSTVSSATLPKLQVSAELEYEGAVIQLSDHDFESEETVVEVGSITGDYDITINNLDINPSIYLRVGNTFPVEAKARITISCENGEVTVDDVLIEKAEWNNGEIVRKGEEEILLARSDTEEEHSFYECDLTSLFEGIIPEDLNVEVEVTSLSGSYTIYATESYAVDYSYRVEMPLKFGSEFSISFSTVASGVGSSMDDLKTLTARNAFLQIEMHNAMPLNGIIPEDGLILLDENDQIIDPAKAYVKIVNGMMAGSSDGKVVDSRIVAQLVLKDGKFENLLELDKIRITMNAESVGKDISLNKNQKVYGKIKLHIEDGIQIEL